MSRHHATQHLHVITCITNPVKYKSRVRLYREFAEYMSKFEHITLWTVEGVYPGCEFEVTQADHPNHLQMVLEDEIWHKEDLLNILVKQKLSVDVPDWQYVAWIDADVQFARADWVAATLQGLQEHAVVQMFSECMDLTNHWEQVPRGMDSGVMRSSVVKWYDNNRLPTEGDYRFAGHFGYAWAATREAWDTLGGLIDDAIVGAADYLMVHGLLGEMKDAVNISYTPGYRNSCYAWGERAKKLNRSVGYVRGMILHHWHGPKWKRGYSERQRILDQHQFDPNRDLTRQANGAFRWFRENPEHVVALQEEMKTYFRSRDEDVHSDDADLY